jgi:mono/diheme cytochrome c family protein
MPPDEAEEFPRLSSDEIEVLKAWVQGGAPAFASLRPDDRPSPAAAAASEPLAVAVKEIFRSRCYECHKLGKAKNGIKILNHDLLVVKRRVIVPGRPEESRLFKLLTTSDKDSLMPQPPAAPLTPAEIDTIRRWILEGAPPFPRVWRP